ncbi:MAG: adenylyltransferase/cytidyltransferase family protein [Candidatus Aenigmarchaeota archaeon]|nr:adenylyltransferase/cytidyltransferase family protein [Candidatus Aenigmarchaeota archaeon]
MKLKTALFAGRFQPLHKGHVNAIKNLFGKYQKVVIVIGSVNKKGTENPFTFQERKTMIDASFKKYKNRYKIIGVPDVESDRKWKNEITGKVKFDVIVTGNRWTAKCFSGYRIIKPKMLNPAKYNATRIRELIKTGRGWQNLVPKEIVPIINKHKAAVFRQSLT